MNCPRCKATIGPLANPDGVVTCPSCGSRLMTRSAMLRSQGAQKGGSGGAATSGGAAGGAAEARAKSVRELPPDSTLPATPAQMLALGRIELDDEPTAVEETIADAKPVADAKAGVDAKAKSDAKANDASRKGAKGGPASAAAAAGADAASASGVPPRQAAANNGPNASQGPGASHGPNARLVPAVNPQPAPEPLDLVLRELRAVRELQERILSLLERSAGGGRGPSGGDDEAEVSPIRARRRKSVVLIDDDAATREAAVAEMTQADIPVRAFAEGSAAISAIADEKPDVIVLELALAGSMEGRDVINMIKATMEWVEIPIVLWTRAPVQNQREARQVHGADEIVAKASGAAALVARVITLFRRVH